MMKQNLWTFAVEQHEKLFMQVVQHLALTFSSLLLAIIVGIPLGILISRKEKLAQFILGIAGILQTIPSIALLGFMIPFFGIGAIPAVIALLIYALLPIIRNTYTGITGVSSNVMEAGKAMGMNPSQLLFKVQFPLAMPVILAGIRTATVINVGVATLASFVGAGGLGEFIFGGISLNNSNMILAGAIPAAFLAILLDQTIAFLQRIKFRNLYHLRILGSVIAMIAIIYYIWPSPPSSKLKAGFTPEFMGRQDGDLGLRAVYNLYMNPKIVSDAIMYKAIHEGKLDIISGYSTDGRIKAFDLHVLEDDKKIFPPYYAAPILKSKTLLKYPDLEKVLNLVAGKITDSIMTEMNYKTDFQQETPEKVAKDFLISIGLYQEAGRRNAGKIRIGSKIFGEQYILAAIYKMLIEGQTSYAVETKTGLGGTKICFDALLNDAIDLYPEYTGTGLLVLLNTKEETIKEVTQNPEKTYQYVQQQFNDLYAIQWLKPLGFNNAYALMMRHKDANDKKIRRISDLKTYLSK